MYYKYNNQNINIKTVKTKTHEFDKVYKKNNIEHRLTKPYTPKTNGMVEKFNKKIQENVIDLRRFKSIQDLEKTIY